MLNLRKKAELLNNLPYFSFKKAEPGQFVEGYHTYDADKVLLRCIEAEFTEDDGENYTDSFKNEKLRVKSVVFSRDGSSAAYYITIGAQLSRALIDISERTNITTLSGLGRVVIGYNRLAQGITDQYYFAWLLKGAPEHLKLSAVETPNADDD